MGTTSRRGFLFGAFAASTACLSTAVMPTQVMAKPVSSLQEAFRPLDPSRPLPGRLIARDPKGVAREIYGFEVAQLPPQVQTAILQETAEVCATYLALPNIGSFLRNDTYNNEFILSLYYPPWKHNLRSPRLADADEIRQVYWSEVQACEQFLEWMREERGQLDTRVFIDIGPNGPTIRNAFIMYLEDPKGFKGRMEQSYRYCAEFVQVPENDYRIRYKGPLKSLYTPFQQPWMKEAKHTFVPLSFNPVFWDRLEYLCRQQMDFSEQFFKWSPPR